MNIKIVVAIWIQYEFQGSIYECNNVYIWRVIRHWIKCVAYITTGMSTNIAVWQCNLHLCIDDMQAVVCNTMVILYHNTGALRHWHIAACILSYSRAQIANNSSNRFAVITNTLTHNMAWITSFTHYLILRVYVWLTYHKPRQKFTVICSQRPASHTLPSNIHRGRKIHVTTLLFQSMVLLS